MLSSETVTPPTKQPKHCDFPNQTPRKLQLLRPEAANYFLQRATRETWIVSKRRTTGCGPLLDFGNRLMSVILHWRSRPFSAIQCPSCALLSLGVSNGNAHLGRLHPGTGTQAGALLKQNQRRLILCFCGSKPRTTINFFWLGKPPLLPKCLKLISKDVWRTKVWSRTSFNTIGSSKYSHFSFYFMEL